jgi:hypothetical protein
MLPDHSSNGQESTLLRVASKFILKGIRENAERRMARTDGQAKKRKLAS